MSTIVWLYILFIHSSFDGLLSCFHLLTIMNIVTIDSPLIFLRCIFWLWWVFVAACGLSLVAMSAGYFVVMLGLLIAEASRCRA